MFQISAAKKVDSNYTQYIFVMCYIMCSYFNILRPPINQQEKIKRAIEKCLGTGKGSLQRRNTNDKHNYENKFNLISKKRN